MSKARQVGATQDALDEFTAAILNRKADKAATLTPVGIERNGPLDGKHDTTFPYDDPQTVHEALRHGLKIIGDLKVELDHVGKGLIALAQLYGLDDEAPSAAAAEAALEVSARERAADEAHRARVASDADANEKVAQEGRGPRQAPSTASDMTQTEFNDAAADFAADFARKAATAQDAAFGGTHEWVCPVHGDDIIGLAKSRSDRTYRTCNVPGCGKFEKIERKV